ncbi:MAG: transglycosylase domain-containing protein [Methylocystis sp.]|uniref:transglycosylase domain-containing protein n=1 Tax=Methylocystis sp. TaxID=1911079 RepID=UPI003DA5E7F2
MSRKPLLVALALLAAAAGGGVLIARDAVRSATLVAPPATSIVYDRNGAFLTQIGNVSRGDGRVDYGYWPLAQIPERVARATLILEDRRFSAHPGVDPRAVLRAVWNNLISGRRIEGASTIAMQVARMQAPAPRSLLNKVREAAAAVAIVAANGHEATLAHYLRLAPYGLGSHGIAHAARFYFDKPVDDLSWAQVALLAAIPQSPGRMNVTRESGLRLAVTRARYAISQLEREGALDTAQAEMARRELAAMRPLTAKRRPETLHLALRYERLAREGRVRAASPDDPRIHATIDLAIERDAAQLARRYLSIFRNAGARQVAVMVAERGSNAVIADVGSADYDDPRAGAFDFTRVARSPGSTLKPFIYALALERGALKPTDLLDDIPEGASGVANADGLYLGPMTARQALANSRNVPATNLLRRVGLEANFDFFHELGLHNLDAPAERFGVSMAIGALPTRLEDLMRAYAALADDGVMNGLSFARDELKPPPRRVMSVDAARLVTSFLADPQARLPSFPRYGPLEYPFAVAVKTGTSQNYRDAWTLAFSRDYIVGVWLGRGDASGMRALAGANSAARLAHAVMTRLHGARPGDIARDAFAPPPGRIAVDLCRADAGAACAQTLREWVKPEDLAAAPATAAAHVEDAAGESAALVIATPEHNMHVWRNPEQPEGLNRLALKLAGSAGAAQIVWIVDGAPFAVAQGDETVFWPMTPGAHRIQARLALAPVSSRPVRVTVE